MPVVQFAPFSSPVQPNFWHELTRMKIDVFRLSDEALTVNGSYSVGRSIRDRETGQDIALGCNLSIGGDAYEKTVQLSPMSVSASGTFKNFNTIEDFKGADKAALFNEVTSKMWDSIVNHKDTSVLSQFLLITFADLKKYQYYYWFAFPAFVSKPAWEISENGWKAADEELNSAQLASIHQSLHANTVPFFLVKVVGNTSEMGSVEKLDEFFANVPPESRIVGFLDPSALAENPGWPLRNLLAYLRLHFPAQTSSVRILCWRDSEVPSPGKSWKSRFGVVSSAEGDSATKPAAVGWERHPTTNKLSARVADLAPMMDPTRLADQAVDLNLKLMRWRILPALDLDKVASTRCLLLGAGTLGCYVARTLMGWGVRTITFVDSARVSFSNPVRQPLFEFEDCLNGGKPKAACAANSLKKIFPGINATGHELSIPMPGHPIPPASTEQTKKDVEKLEKLFDEHDVVFLLMDSRESRWLPTVLGAAKGKIVMNAALGFDTYLVMRHGARASTSTANNRLGCYYCNDIVAPADSLTDRTLDQMCTVTRPGLASIAASTTVELLMSLLQHPDGIHAPPPPPQASGEHADPSTSGSVLGLVPHQLRGFLAQFRNLPITGAAYDRCTGCSEIVLKAYEEQGFDVLLKAFNEPGYLETLTGLDKLYNEGDAAMESVDWDEEDEDEV
ncbi:E1-like protein-activating [Leucogyrophana mollusca]|uniref:E1-like protein-activating n=1 Tax=Leucogyrophana mollusca TaxID=85980 RepID=A0ACB8B3Q6_9AGAM|nr:E1-like protein-activating [Leucogyrophana mollusca]